MTDSYHLPAFLYTDRLRLDLIDYSEAHATCLLACLNNPTAYERVGDFGVKTVDALDRMLTGTRLRCTDKSIPDYRASSFREHELVDYDCYYLLRLIVARRSYLIGAVSMSQRAGNVPPDIGWSVLEKYHGHGYATEAARELLRLAREKMGLAEVVALSSPANIQSIKVATKIGLVEGGQVREEASGELQSVYMLPGMLIEGISSVLL